MDNENKLESVYKPESNARKKKVLVALSGGIDSFVTAYLLKIQKYDLIGATIVNATEAWKEDLSGLISCHLSQEKLVTIQEFCQQLNIPHMAIKNSGEFQEEVVEKWVGSRLLGLTHRSCWDCHLLRFKLLFEKMKQAGAESLATGHFAKIYHNEQTHQVSVQSSNDESNDQSALLARLPNEILSSLMLPLSDLQKKEVLKLAENFGLNALESKLKIHECFPNTETSIKYLESKIPVKMRGKGEVLDAYGTNKFGDHSGVFQFEHGKEFKTYSQKNNKLYLFKYTQANTVINLNTEEGFKQKKIHLIDCETPEDTSWPEPFKGVIQLNSVDIVDCWVYPKSVKSAVVEWDTPLKVIEGDVVAIFKKKGKNAKLLLTGKVRYLPPEPVINEKDKNVKKVNYHRDL